MAEDQNKSITPDSDQLENSGEFVLYQTEDGKARVQVRLANNTVWLTQKQMAELFQTSVANINIHLKNLFEEEELDADSVIKEYLITAADNKKYNVAHYNMDVIIAMGYRVRSHRGTQFRQWATGLLSEYVIKGFVMDDERLKDVRNIGQDYFEELLERIRDIRASERKFYQKITDIYATSMDYDPNHKITQQFFATVQNKLHWAIHGQTAAEIIYNRADADKQNMGLTTWKNSPGGRIRRSDVDVAKNYLSSEELRELNRIVTMYLDYAEMMALNRKPMTMAQWAERLDAFLQFNERNILTNSGKISAELAKEKAEAEFEKYEGSRRALESSRPTSDFDQFVEKTKQLPRRSGDE